MNDPLPSSLHITPPSQGFSEGTMNALRRELGRCPDLAFAHLVEVGVEDEGGGSNPVLFAWLQQQALGSLRQALNLVAEAVARALPDGCFVDVVILNSAPELLPEVERAGCLLVEPDAEERARALEAAEHGEGRELEPARRRLWPF